MISPAGGVCYDFGVQFVLSVLALAAIFVNAERPAAALAPVPETLASIKSCSVVLGAITRRGTATEEVIRVSFAINHAAADVARFTVSSPGGTFRDFTARGLFSQGTVIADRVLRADPSSQQEFYSLGAGTGVECILTYLHFVDGTSWTPRPPIEVTGCEVIRDAIAQRGSIQELIRISFAVEQGPPADVARFTLKTPNGDYAEFTARGSLSRGTAIADRIVIADPEAQRQFYSLGSSVGCEVSFVHFIDGSSWNAPVQELPTR
jgi:hypothetical protein